MELNINGEKKTIPSDVNTVTELLEHLKVQKETVVVEHNLKILKRQQLMETALKAGDTIEIIRFVAGG